ncbi:MAG: beta-lactamase family protein, partial [Alicyclobacillus sp.]|nr:beta-lactamase family protein [Alicyclobacillus sp.]
MTSARLPRSTPAAQGIDARGIHAFLDACEASDLMLHSFMLLRHGTVVAEGWWKPYAPDVPHMMFSLSKSFTSTAVGFAVAEGRLTVDDAVLSFFPDLVTPEIETNMGTMRVRNLLSMSTGHAEDTFAKIQRAEDGDWVRGFLNLPIQ